MELQARIEIWRLLAWGVRDLWEYRRRLQIAADTRKSHGKWCECTCAFLWAVLCLGGVLYSGDVHRPLAGTNDKWQDVL